MSDRSAYITVVSGLPRSGTSMMMSMLEAGGIPLLVDGVRQADVDNPKGYYEFELVKKIKKDQSWLPQARGKAVKMISQLLLDLPPEQHYKVIFMRRHIDEIMASQNEMLRRRGTYKEGVDEREMARMMLTHVRDVLKWLDQQSFIDTLEIDYNAMLLSHAVPIQRINDFLGGDLNTEAMAAVVDKKLYRQRSAE